MNILIITNELAYFRAHRERLALDLISKGYKVSVASGVVNERCLRGWNKDIELISLDLDRHKLNPIADLRTVIRLFAEIRKRNFDLIHCITIKPILLGGLANFAAKPFGTKTKTVWTFAGLGKIYENNFQTLGTKIRRFIVSSALTILGRFLPAHVTFENEEDRCRMVSCGVFRDKFTHLISGTGIDIQQFSPAKNKTKNGPITFIMATRLIKEKGVDTYLETAKALKDQDVDAKFLVAGLIDPSNPDCVDEEKLHKAAKDGVIEYLGPISQREMPKILNKADILCLPTRLAEGFPRSLLEAASCGLAMIASDQSSIRVLVKPGATGWLIDSNKISSFQAAVKQAVDNPEKSREMGRKARELIQELPVGAAAVAEEFVAVYKQSSLANS